MSRNKPSAPKRAAHAAQTKVKQNKRKAASRKAKKATNDKKAVKSRSSARAAVQQRTTVDATRAKEWNVTPAALAAAKHEAAQLGYKDNVRIEFLFAKGVKNA